MRSRTREKIEAARIDAERRRVEGSRLARDGKRLGKRCAPTVETRAKYSAAAQERWRREFLEGVRAKEQAEAEAAARTFPIPVLSMYDLFRDRGLILDKDPQATAAGRMSDVLFFPRVFGGYSVSELETAAS